MATPELGDLIEIFRGSYEHWAVYVGDDFIVHLTLSSDDPGASANSLMSVTTEKAMVKKEKLMDVVGTDRWKINNSLDEEYKPRSVQVIVREALAKVGEELQYDFLGRNCEHFAKELRYGKAESWQAVQVGLIIIPIIVASVVAPTTMIVGIVVMAVVVLGVGWVFGGFFSKRK